MPACCKPPATTKTPPPSMPRRAMGRMPSPDWRHSRKAKGNRAMAAMAPRNPVNSSGPNRRSSPPSGNRRTAPRERPQTAPENSRFALALGDQAAFCRPYINNMMMMTAPKINCLPASSICLTERMDRSRVVTVTPATVPPQEPRPPGTWVAPSTDDHRGNAERGRGEAVGDATFNCWSKWRWERKRDHESGPTWRCTLMQQKAITTAGTETSAAMTPTASFDDYSLKTAPSFPVLFFRLPDNSLSTANWGPETSPQMTASTTIPTVSLT